MKFPWLKKKNISTKGSCQKEYEEMKFQAIRSQLNSHFIFNSLNAIQHYLTINEKTLSLEYLSMFGKLVRYHLGDYENQNISIKEELQMLDIYLKLQKLRYEDKFIYEFLVENELDDHSREIPKNLIGSLFENILESEIMYDTHPLYLSVKIKLIERGINIKLSFKESDKPEILNKTYRIGFIKWEDQVMLINKIKNSNIDKEPLIKVHKSTNADIMEIEMFIPF